MRDIEIEAWVLRIADQVSLGQRVEDTLVELKARWPENAATAARRIAGHANAARSASILWIIGIDEEQGVCGANPLELADWLAAVRSEFNDIYPPVRDLNARVGQKTVVALLFDTERAPFVVKNPAFGQPGGGPIQYETPWREGTSVRSATRQDLIRLLAPLTRLPELEFLQCRLSVTEDSNVYQGPSQWDFYGSLYVIPSSDRNIVFPFHRCSLTATLPDKSIVDFSADLRLSAPTSAFGLGRGAGGAVAYRDSVTVESSNSEAVVSGPGMLILTSSAPKLANPHPVDATVSMELSLHVVGASSPAVVKLELQPIPVSSGKPPVWAIASAKR